MRGREYLVVAKRLAQGATEAEWRTAVGRAYYALFAEARAIQDRWGFSKPAHDRAHPVTRFRFVYANDPDLKSIGYDLEQLGSLRSKADYRLDVVGQFGNPVAASDAVQDAADQIALLDQIDADPRRAQRPRPRCWLAGIECAFHQNGDIGLTMLIFDAHLDLAWNAIDWNRDLTLSLDEVRRGEAGMTGKARGYNTVTLPEMRKGHVGVCIATLLARLLRDTMPPLQRYQSMTSAYAAAVGQMTYYRQMEAQGHLRWLRTATDLNRHLSDWSDPAAATAPIGFILSMEGADPVLSPSQVEAWWNEGLRIIGPAHYGVSPYAHGTGTEGGLFPDGPALLREMARVGMILDVTHLSDQCFDEALDLYDGPVLASHHNCRTLVPGQRQLTDSQIKRLIERGVVIGMALDAWMIYPGWVRGETQPEVVGLDALIDHVDHVCQLAGNARHVAIGSDLDGGFGTEQTPRDVKSIADLQKVPALLRARGYKEEDVANTCHGNWERFFQGALPK